MTGVDTHLTSRGRCAGFVLAGVLVPCLSAWGQGAPAPAGLPEYARAFHRGEYPRAMALAADRLKAEPADLQARIVRARAEAALGDFDAALEGFREVLRIAPQDPDALYFVGITAGVLAEMEFDRLLKLAPESARAHQLLGESYQAQGRVREAQAEYRAALEADPQAVEVLTALGDLVRSDLGLSKEHLAEARSYYSRAAERAPQNYDALYGLGACDAYAGEHASAARSFERAVKVAPDSAPAHLGLGISLLQTGRAESAVTALEAAARLEPRMREAHYNLGRAYHELGRSEEAQAAFAVAQELMREGEVPDADADPRRRP